MKLQKFTTEGTEEFRFIKSSVNPVVESFLSVLA